MKNNKNQWKLLLDVAMIIVLALLYRKTAINLAFHEIAGLVLMGAFLLHLALNQKWIIGVTKKLFSKNVATKTRIGYLVDMLLLVSFVLIGVSGVCISKVVFSFHIQGDWKIIHYFCSALSIVLIGVHVGLHSSFIGGMFKSLLHLRNNVARIIVIMLTVIICGFGSLSFTTSSFMQWLSMPFSMAQMGSIPQRQMHEGGIMGTESQGTEMQAADSNSPKTSHDQPQGGGQGGERPNKNQGDHNGQRGLQSGITTALLTLCQFFSMMYVVATLTVLLEKALCALHCKKQLAILEKNN